MQIQNIYIKKNIFNIQSNKKKKIIGIFYFVNFIQHFYTTLHKSV